MSLVGFICKDGERVKREDCFNACRLDDRCFSLRYLLLAGHNREWKGKPSTTQLLNSTRMEFLRIKYPYYILPSDKAYAVLGTRGHAELDFYGKKKSEIISEYGFDGDISGILDCLEPCEGGFILIDNKVWGSYQIKKSGADDSLQRETLQLNNYRVKAENDEKLASVIGKCLVITKMLLEVIVRDGNTKSAFMQGVDKKIYRLPIAKLPDSQVIQFFEDKKQLLLSALDKDVLPQICTDVENWNWKRCKKNFCEVWESCPEGQTINRKGVIKLNA